MLDLFMKLINRFATWLAKVTEGPTEGPGSKRHVCNYQMVHCPDCQPGTNKASINGRKTPAGMDEYGNRCDWCDGTGFVERCANCEMGIE